MKSVLLPSDDRPWILNFAGGYRDNGFEVIVGAMNFELESANPDILHLNWPEELTGWKCPTRTQLRVVLDRLERWSRRTKIILSVNNLYPKAPGPKHIWRDLYLGFYNFAEVIHHFSQTSKALVCQEFPEISDRNHLVRVGCNYERLLELPTKSRSEYRASLGFKPTDFVVLAFGALRTWSEVSMLCRGIEGARAEHLKLLFAGRFSAGEPTFANRLRRLQLEAWLRRVRASRITGFVDESEVPSLFEAADAVVVVRHEGLGSGIPWLAMTLGKLVIAPDVGAIPEGLKGTQNPIYDPSETGSLARAFDKAAASDWVSIGKLNRNLAAGWSWRTIISECVSRVPL